VLAEVLPTDLGKRRLVQTGGFLAFALTVIDVN